MNDTSIPRRMTVGTMLVAAALVGCNGGSSPGPKTGDDVQTDGPDTGGGGEGGLVGSEAPEVQATALMGDGPTTLSEARGQVVIVDFWATFCDPCRKSFPKYQDLVDKYAGDLAVIAVSVDDPEDVAEDEVKKFAEDLGVSFSIVWDKEQKTAQAYDPPKMPTSYIVGPEGKVRHVHEGFEGGEAQAIDQEVQALLAE